MVCAALLEGDLQRDVSVMLNTMDASAVGEYVACICTWLYMFQYTTHTKAYFTNPMYIGWEIHFEAFLTCIQTQTTTLQ